MICFESGDDIDLHGWFKVSSESGLCLTLSFPWLSLGASRVQMPTAAICPQLLHLMTGECSAALETQNGLFH